MPPARWRAYAESKLADLMFVFELDRRAIARGLPVKGLAAHPGYSATGLMGAGPGAGGPDQRARVATVPQSVFSSVGQPAEIGALPTLMAATADLPGSTYVGPSGPLQMSGSPVS